MAVDIRSSCNRLMNPMRLSFCLAGWINREQQAVIEYLSEEIRILKEIHGKRLRFNDALRRRIAVKVKKIRYGRLKEIVNIVTPQTLLRWFRALVAMPLSNSGCNSDHLILCGTDLITVFRQSRPTNDRLA